MFFNAKKLNCQFLGKALLPKNWQFRAKQRAAARLP
jgi:hypothetical protein